MSMYDGAIKSTAEGDKQSLLPAFAGRFGNLNDEQSGLINNIEDKLHSIINKRVPENDAKSDPPNIGDFVTAADLQLKRVELANRRLEGILNHLSQLI